MKKESFSVLALSALIMAGGSASAQNTGAIDQVEAQKQQRETQKILEDGQNAPESYPGENSDLGPQTLLKRREKKTHFEIMMDTQFYYTSNMFFEEDGNKEETSVNVSTLQLALAPSSYSLGDGKFQPRIGYRHQWFFHGIGDDRGRLEEFDFNAQSFFIDGQYRLNDWVFDAGVEYTRLLYYDDYSEFYRELAPRFGVRKLFALNDRTILSLGIREAYHLTKTDDFEDSNDLDRLDHIFLASLSLELAHNLYWQPFYRLQYTDYLGERRNDFLHTCGCYLQYYFCKRFAVRTFATYDIRDSSRDRVEQYKKFDGGVGLNFVFRF
jgi:hypothetical protein